MTNILPNFLIIGAMRCGTTSLTRYLDTHPDVFMAPQKELHYFDLNYDKGDEWYKQQFRGAEVRQAIGEATQTYMYNCQVPARMSSLLPETRLIAILRNPVDRAYSHYWHNHSRGKEPLEFVEAITAETERLYNDQDLLSRYFYSYLDRGSYLSQLLRICEYYPRESLLVILSEDLYYNPSETFQQVCRFLKIDEQFVPPNLGVAVNAYTSFRSIWLRNALRGLPSNSLIKRIVGRLNQHQHISYPPLEPTVRSKLLEYFERDNAALASWLGRDLTIWMK